MQASVATSESTNVAPSSSRGSRELSAAQLAITLFSAIVSTTPATIPAPTLTTVDRNTIPRTCAVLAPKRDADAELVRPLHHRVGHDAVQTHRRQGQRQRRKRPEKPRNKLPARTFGHPRNPVLKIAHIVVRLLVGIDGIHRRTNGVQQFQRRHVRSNKHLRVHSHGHGVGNKCLRKDRLGETIIKLVRYHTNDQQTIFDFPEP